jgi:arginyl-tRNA synthetase
MSVTIFDAYRQHILGCVHTLQAQGVLGAEIDTSAVTVEPPREASHGDLASNAAMVLAKPARLAPRVLAEKLAPLLEAMPQVVKVEVAGPGFINLRLSNAFWCQQITEVFKAGPNYGRSSLGAGQHINVEYVSANPTGPMHMGHCRGAVVGDALAQLLDFAGFRVVREYYINDAGSQVDTLARSAHLRYQEAYGRQINIPEGYYPGDYLMPIGQALREKFGPRFLDAAETEWLDLFKRESVMHMMALIRSDLATLGIRHDVFFSEQSLYDQESIPKALQAMEALDLIYTGVLEAPKGELPEDWEARPQRLFKATLYGDDVDRPLQKSDGRFTYFAADIAYHRDKLERGFAGLINLWGADHGGYVKRMSAAVRALSQGRVPLDVRLVQMVRLFRNGEPVKMSKRSGSFVTLADVVEEVGKDVVRFMMLTRKSDSQLDFDFAKVLEQSRENPVFYVHYAHARICSAFKRAQEACPQTTFAEAALQHADLSQLSDAGEIALMQQVSQWPRIVEKAALAHEPHRIAFYLYELASAVHAAWNRGNDYPELRFVRADAPALTQARLALLWAVRQVIRNGLAVMGVEPVEEMH